MLRRPRPQMSLSKRSRLAHTQADVYDMVDWLLRECTEYDVDKGPDEQFSTVTWITVSRQEGRRFIVLGSRAHDMGDLAKNITKGMRPVRISQGEAIRMLRTLQNRPQPALVDCPDGRTFNPCLAVDLVAEWRTCREKQERHILRWIACELANYDPDELPEEQTNERIAWHTTAEWSSDEAHGHHYRMNMNYIEIRKGNVRELADYVGARIREPRVPHDIVLRTLCDLEKRTLRTEHYVPPFVDFESKSAPETRTIPAVMEMPVDGSNYSHANGYVTYLCLAVELFRSGVK